MTNQQSGASDQSPPNINALYQRIGQLTVALDAAHEQQAQLAVEHMNNLEHCNKLGERVRELQDQVRDRYALTDEEIALIAYYRTLKLGERVTVSKPLDIVSM